MKKLTTYLQTYKCICINIQKNNEKALRYPLKFFIFYIETSHGSVTLMSAGKFPRHKNGSTRELNARRLSTSKPMPSVHREQHDAFGELTMVKGYALNVVLSE